MSLSQKNIYPDAIPSVFASNQSEYLFATSHHPEQSNVYRLKLIQGIDKSIRIHQEMIRLRCWPQLEINFNKPVITIYPVLSDGEHYLPEMRFYRQTGNNLFGEDSETNRCIFGQVCGPVDKNGVCIPTTVSLSVSKTRFNNINLFNYPTIHHKEWEMALKKKWDLSIQHQDK